ncbi:LPS assembly protein LptD [Pseudothauera nasutitermitis]|uniref:LPS-assembly protein LptD n=1 Tax=Pseudothauera nasutitermitis TaxID=2565930 RepID=A0A4S4B077_9RHOO|nr:LPS-assembly protein LptD [Pseudothauera nasutitermitis]THF65873.1 LPS assembly protein LptD [Pseudothauera nasutitermitis]
MKVIPLLLCWVSGGALASGLPALVVSPDLVRERPGKTPVVRPAATQTPAPAPAPSVQPPASRPAAGTAGPGLAPAPAAPGTEVRPVTGHGEPSDAPTVAPTPPASSAPAPAAASPAAVVPARAAPTVDIVPVPGASTGDGREATEVSALRIRGTRAVELAAEGEAELQRGALTLTADRLTYRELTDEAVAEGNVRLVQGTDEVSGPAARIVVGERTGEFESPSYSLTRRSEPEPGEVPREIVGSGQAEALQFEGENQYRLRNATWTSCSPADPDWYVKARDLHLDYDTEVGTLRDGTVVFKDVPILWLPWADFPLTARRQSGLLAPTFGTSNRTGVDFTQPYYWNIAPNYDATISPRFMSRRGLQLGGEFRYLNADYQGELRAEWLPKDRVAGIERRLGSLQHQHRITPRLRASLDLNSVSDDDYFEDLSSRVSVASKVNLLRQGRLDYQGADWWSASALWQRYQTLSGTEPYRKLPQLALNANRADMPWGTVWTFNGQYTDFDHPDKDLIRGGYRVYTPGNRLVLYPQVALPIERAGFYITPKIGLHYTRYKLDEPYDIAKGKTSITRSVPIFSVDSGLNFEREATLFGNDYVQTLEPRVFYVRSPGRDQDAIPLFDTYRYDFSFAQMFSEMPYSGHDRIADNDQVTVALTSRLIDPRTGAERLYAAIGQRHYFSDQEVGLPGETLRVDRRTDILAALGGQISASTALSSAWQYNPRESQTERFTVGARWQPEFGKALNLNYRWTRDVLRDVDVSAQWPLGGNWYGVGRLTRSIKDRRVTEAIAGFEYNGGCWVFRTVAHRFATTEDRVTQSLFFQLELNGLASIGSNPVGLLKRSVSGYGKINEPGSGRIFGTD